MLIGIFKLTARIKSGMKECIIKLPVISHRSHYLLTVGLNIVNHIDVLRVSVNNPVEAVELVRAAVSSLSSVLSASNTPLSGQNES
jgi:hypothetical protein